MRSGSSVFMVLLLGPSLAGCGSKDTDPSLRPHVAESTDPSGMEYVPRPMLADDDSVGVYTDEVELLEAHPDVTAACYFRDYADFIVRFSDVTRNSWEQEERFQFVKDRTAMARWTARGCGAEAVFLRQTSTLVRPRRVFNSQTGGIRWIDGRERVTLEWFGLSATPVPQPEADDEAEESEGEAEG